MSSSSSDSNSSESESSKRAVKKTQKRKRPSPEESSDSEDEQVIPQADESSDNEDEASEDVTPVLSHAELRKQKKKQKKLSEPVAEDDTQPKKTPKVKNTAELPPFKVPKRQNSVWVGNLSFKTTPESLHRFFDGVGEITRVHLPTKMASAGPGARGAVKENRGFAYVDFATPEAKTIAITLSENPLDGRKLLIKDGDDFTGRPSTSAQDDAENPDQKSNLTGHTKTAQKILKVQKQPAGPTLFLGNLGFETTEDSIRDLFTRNRVVKAEQDAPKEEDSETKKEEGEPKKDKWIRKIRMGTFEDTGKCKGWAFADFTTTDHATAALTNPKNHFLNGRKLVVEYASPEAVRRGGAGSRPKNPSSNPSATDDGKQHRERVRPKRTRDADGDAEPAEAAGSPAKRQRVEGGERAPRERRERREWDSEGRKTRAKPGAALASAKRETMGIVPSQGKKIVF